jgi:tetratricopeptide (TPR) repeat protein
MAEIMGRPTPATEEAPAIEEAPPEVPEEPIEVPAAEEAAPLEEPEWVAERPAWLESVDMPSAEETLGWLEKLVEAGEELPAEAQVEAEAVLEEEAFGWTAFAEPPIAVGEAAEPVSAEPELEEVEAAAPEEVPEEEIPVAEVPEVPAPEEAPPVEVLEPELEEVEAPAPEEVPEEEIPVAEVPEAVVEAVEEEVPLVEELAPAPEPAWAEAEEALELVEVPPAEVIAEAPVEDLERFFAAKRAYAEEHPQDYEAWLELGRVLWQGDRRADAVETYSHLIGRKELLDEVIPDLEDYVAQAPDATVQQALGDAYMQADRLSDALDIYRRALQGL